MKSDRVLASDSTMTPANWAGDKKSRWRRMRKFKFEVINAHELIKQSFSIDPTKPSRYHTFRVEFNAYKENLLELARGCRYVGEGIVASHFPFKESVRVYVSARDEDYVRFTEDAKAFYIPGLPWPKYNALKDFSLFIETFSGSIAYTNRGILTLEYTDELYTHWRGSLELDIKRPVPLTLEIVEGTVKKDKIRRVVAMDINLFTTYYLTYDIEEGCYEVGREAIPSLKAKYDFLKRLMRIEVETGYGVLFVTEKLSENLKQLCFHLFEDLTFLEHYLIVPNNKNTKTCYVCGEDLTKRKDKIRVPLYVVEDVEVTLEHTYYYCPKCKKAVDPHLNACLNMLRKARELLGAVLSWIPPKRSGVFRLQNSEQLQQDGY